MKKKLKYYNIINIFNKFTIFKKMLFFILFFKIQYLNLFYFSYLSLSIQQHYYCFSLMILNY